MRQMGAEKASRTYICRLVKEHDVRVPKRHFGKAGPRLLTARQVFHRHGRQLPAQPKPAKVFPKLSFGRFGPDLMICIVGSVGGRGSNVE